MSGKKKELPGAKFKEGQRKVRPNVLRRDYVDEFIHEFKRLMHHKGYCRMMYYDPKEKKKITFHPKRIPALYEMKIQDPKKKGKVPKALPGNRHDGIDAIIRIEKHPDDKVSVIIRIEILFFDSFYEDVIEVVNIRALSKFSLDPIVDSYVNAVEARIMAVLSSRFPIPRFVVSEDLEFKGE